MCQHVLSEDTSAWGNNHPLAQYKEWNNREELIDDVPPTSTETNVKRKLIVKQALHYITGKQNFI